MQNIEMISKAIQELDNAEVKVKKVENELTKLYQQAAEIQEKQKSEFTLDNLQQLQNLEQLREPLEKEVKKQKEKFAATILPKLRSLKQNRKEHIQNKVLSDSDLKAAKLQMESLLEALLTSYKDYRDLHNAIVKQATEEINETGFKEYAQRSDYTSSSSYETPMGFPYYLEDTTVGNLENIHKKMQSEL